MNDETPETAAGGEVAVYEDVGGEVRVEVPLDRDGVAHAAADGRGVRQHARERVDALAQHIRQRGAGSGGNY